MIASGIWSKRFDAGLRAIFLTPLLVLLGGCDAAQVLLGRSPAPPPTGALPTPRPSASQADVSAGLSPLPTPQQVLTAVPFGRSDPFAPLPVAPPAATATTMGARAATPQPGAASGASGGAAAPSPGGAAAGSPAAPAAAGGPPGKGPAASPSPLEGFRLTGVIRSGGHAEALVSFGTLSGSLRQGDRGGRTTDLLPDGWRLTAIQFGGRSPHDPPSITLQHGMRQEKVSL